MRSPYRGKIYKGFQNNTKGIHPFYDGVARDNSISFLANDNGDEVCVHVFFVDLTDYKKDIQKLYESVYRVQDNIKEICFD